MIDRATLLEALAEYERQEQQALADASAARGAALAILALLQRLDHVESLAEAGKAQLE